MVALQQAFQDAESRFATIVKTGRTEMQDAVLTTLGREMGAYAEALGRDRWRIYKCEERLRVVNLGGTAIGTGLAAPRAYIFRVVEELRAITGIGFARAENLVEATQNADVFVEVSGMLKALRRLVALEDLLRPAAAVRPRAGLGEIRLPARQAGLVHHAREGQPGDPRGGQRGAMLVMGYDATVAQAAAAGSLELNPFLPLVAACLLESLLLLQRACLMLRRSCVEGIVADEAACRRHVEASSAAATALVPEIGYDAACEVVKAATESGATVRTAAVDGGFVTAARFDELLTAEAVCRLGTPTPSTRGSSE